MMRVPLSPRALLWATVAACAVLAVPSAVQANETPFQQETRRLTSVLPCGWVSMHGRTGPSHGAGHFDFSCKGGTWGTVTLLLDASNLDQQLSRVRLAYRDWDPAVNPSAGEAMVAEQFLQVLLNRYVPAPDAAAVRQAFWGSRTGSWRTEGYATRVWKEAGQGYETVWLEIKGPLAGMARPLSAPLPTASTPGRDGGLMQPELPSLHNLPEPQGQPQPPIQLSPPSNRATAPGENLRLPPSLQEDPSPTLRRADPRQLETAPAPESLEQPEAPPPIEPELIPGSADLIDGRAPAPTNFEAYNRAEELTREIERRAFEASQAAAAAESPIRTAPPPAEAAPSLPPVPTPNTAPTPPQAPPPATPPAPPAAQEPQTPPQAQPQDPRFAPERPLPQLKFIPKAEPLDTSGDVIRFADEQAPTEGSGL